jgi:radical SAM superfamily enzyme with C-terminal helix-hairpin-helix motif
MGAPQIDAIEGMALRVLIIDGYTDEPAGLGVPPYIDVYPRYIAGAIWKYDPSAEIFYKTIDEVRQDPNGSEAISSSSDLSILVAGVTVPGKYLGGAPATAKDALSLPRILLSKHTGICGPAVRFGFGRGGGSTTEIPKELRSLYEFVISGDPETVLYDLLSDGFDARTDIDAVRTNENSINDFAARGARIIEQHPCYPAGLMCEVETFRGCPRSLRGGCSFCTEPLHGTPDFRSVSGIAKEIAALHTAGALNFRLGRQPDLLIYGTKDQNEAPAPNPRAVRRLFMSVRKAAPALKVLHIDNINPATILNHPDAAEEALKAIVEYHTPGDVAAMGVESADPEVIRKNNLKIYPDGVIFAISLVNGIGGERGENGMPHLLPGINFVYGLPGETKRTYEANLELMKNVLELGLMVRRINMRQVMVMPSTRLSSFGDHLARKHKQLFLKHKAAMRSQVDEPMLKRVLPTWTVLRDLRTELAEGRITWARQVGSYPILVGIQKTMALGQITDAVVVSHGPRSVGALPVPIKVNSMSLKEFEAIPGIGSRRAATLIRHRPYRNADEIRAGLDDPSLLDPIIPLIEIT